jgi:sugar phosphate isomerase/epimerase
MENRRDFVKKMGVSALSLTMLSQIAKAFPTSGKRFFDISLAQWSFHKSLFGGKMSNMDFPTRAKKEFDIDIVEYVSVFFNKKETDKNYLKELKQRTDDLGVFNHLIMVDGEGDLGDTDAKARQTAVENHYKWVDATKFLGGKTIRVNASGKGSREAVGEAAVAGLAKLTDYAKAQKINVIVENHGGYSSDGKWLANVMEKVNSPYCGTLPDFGNFRISATEEYDIYKGVSELLPYAKGISAKTFNFDANGQETKIDYVKMFNIIKKSGWTGIVGIEYEGDKLSEGEGIMLTKKLLEKVREI